MTREERNVLVFLAVGILLGTWPRSGHEEAEALSDPQAEVVVVDFFPIDLNSASPELLSELPGIGPAKANAIVERRQQRGPFQTVEDLAEVRGIGPKTVERLRPLVRAQGTGTGEQGKDRLGERSTRNSPDGERGHHLGAARAGEEPAEIKR